MYTIREIANMLGYSTEAIYGYVRRGRLETVPDSSPTVVTLPALWKFLLARHEELLEELDRYDGALSAIEPAHNAGLGLEGGE